MKHLVIILALCSCLAAADQAVGLEAFTLKDGRAFVGTYDETTGRLSVAEFGISIAVQLDQITKRRPATEAEIAKVTAATAPREAAAKPDRKLDLKPTDNAADKIIADEAARKQQVKDRQKAEEDAKGNAMAAEAKQALVTRAANHLERYGFPETTKMLSFGPDATLPVSLQGVYKHAGFGPNFVLGSKTYTTNGGAPVEYHGMKACKHELGLGFSWDFWTDQANNLAVISANNGKIYIFAVSQNKTCRLYAEKSSE